MSEGELVLVKNFRAPDYKGYWCHNPHELRFMSEKNPNIWIRFWMRFFFNIKWVEENK